MEEEKKDLINSKQRRIDINNTSTPAKTEEPKLDFWQRRNLAKSKEKVKEESVPMETQSSDVKVTGVKDRFGTPLKKASDEKEAKDTGKSNLFSKFETSGQVKTNETPKSKGINYADKFKELNDRNLKQLGSEEKVVKDNKTSDKNVTSDFQPKAKPRQVLANKFEKMDTTETKPEPKPVPRFQKPSNLSPKASPRNLDNSSKSPPTTKNTKFSKPKSPTQLRKTEFKLDLSKGSSAKAVKESPSSPPPLPASTPPKLPLSEPPKAPLSSVSKFEIDTKSPKSSPRSSSSSTGFTNSDKLSPSVPKAVPRKSENISTGILRPKSELVPPSKPPRTSVIVETNRSHSPMDTSEVHEPAKAVVKGPSVGHEAVLVVPNRSNDEKKNREVFGGLLKSLADVRTKHESETVTNKGALAGVGSDLNKSSEIKDKPAPSTNFSNRFSRLPEPKSEEKHPVKIPERPKSSFVIQNKFMEQEKSDNKHPVTKMTKVTKTTTTTTVVTNDNKRTTVIKDVIQEETNDDDIPEWKRKLEERKKAKARPKSADLLGEKTKTDDLLDWQREAAKRKEQRKGGYDDPEKPKIKPISAIIPSVTDKDNTNQNSESAGFPNRPMSPKQFRPPDKKDKSAPAKTDSYVNDIQSSKEPERRKININGDMFKKDDSETSDKQKKKITVDHKFKFEDLDVKAGPKKPPRPTEPPQVTGGSHKMHPFKSPPPKAIVSNFQVRNSKLRRYYSVTLTGIITVYQMNSIL